MSTAVPDLHLFTGDTNRNRILKRAATEKIALKTAIHKLPGKVHATTDAWTSDKGDPFMAVTIHGLDDNFVPHSFLIGFKELRVNHSGENIATCYREIVNDEFNLKGKVGTICTDNAKNNDTFIKCLLDSEDLDSPECHIRCFGHVLNLAAGVVLKEVSDKLTILREAIKKIKWSAILVDRLEKLCLEEKIHYKALILDVATRWNSSVDMLGRSIHLKPALLRMFKELFSGTEEQITEEEWMHFELVFQFLEDFKMATEQCSGEKYVTFSLAMPWYNALLENCAIFKAKYSAMKKSRSEFEAEFATLRRGSDEVRKRQITALLATIPSDEMLTDMINATDLCFEKLDQYYQKQSDLVYAATVLDPTLNIHYFVPNEDQQEQGSVADALREVKAVYDKTYNHPLLERNTILSSQAPPSKLSRIHRKTKNIAKSPMMKAHEVDTYCSMDPLEEESDPLAWWRENRVTFPKLSVMARDILSIPATSTPSERAFSSARHLLPFTRNRMNATSIEACMIVKNSLKCRGPK